MKQSLTFVLLLITMAGTFFPCCLVDKCGAEEVAATHNDKKDKQEGGCSPFSSCASCAGCVAPDKPIIIIEPAALVAVHHTRLITANPASYATSFWQPPRVS